MKILIMKYTNVYVRVLRMYQSFVVTDYTQIIRLCFAMFLTRLLNCLCTNE